MTNPEGNCFESESSSIPVEFIGFRVKKEDILALGDSNRRLEEDDLIGVSAADFVIFRGLDTK